MKCGYPQVKQDSQGSMYTHRCGQCIGCRVTRSEEWTARILLEAQNYPRDEVCFVTLTYDDENLPRTEAGLPTTRIEHLTAFMRRLRANTGQRIRFYGCSEYGKKGKRPHLHVMLFGFNYYGHVMRESWEPNKKQRARLEANGTQWRGYIGAEMEVLRAWGCKGSISIGEFNERRAGYVAKYITKNALSDQDLEPDQEKEKSRMSRNPALGSGAAIALAERLEKAGFKVEEMCAPGDESPIIPLKHFELQSTKGYGETNELGGQTASKRRKKGYPIHTTIRKKMIAALGGDKRSEERKKAEAHIRAVAPGSEEKFDPILVEQHRKNREAILRRKFKKRGTL